MVHFQDRAGFANNDPTAHGVRAVKVVALIVMILCVVAFLIFFGEGLATVAGRYQTTPMDLIGP
jgi:hypothetical protein